jgi:hypothetical protein
VRDAQHARAHYDYVEVLHLWNIARGIAAYFFFGSDLPS